MDNAGETASFITWIDVLGAVWLLLERNAQPVSYTQMDSLTFGIYPLIPLSDTGFPSHAHLQTAISYYRCCPSPPCSFLPLTRNSDVGTSEQPGMATGAWPPLACGLGQGRVCPAVPAPSHRDALSSQVCLLNKGENGEDGDICWEAVSFIRYIRAWGRSSKSISRNPSSKK